ncbi:MAG TPA: hypothetical protein VMI34_20560 [Candidatus Bathyarchaeia archaeon]|nr:hypothetical protein [Candidatus Bathyarchaeia archaeon]
MDTVIKGFLWLHVLAGTVALVVAPIALMTAKGGPAHRRWGKVYFWAMAVVAATAVAVAYWRSILFLMLTAVFSFYAALSGYRVLFRKRPDRGERPTTLDWAAAGITMAASALLVFLGITKPTPRFQELSTVAIVFGCVGLSLSGLDVRRFLHPPVDRMAWWYRHMANMIGSYIAAVTAFSVVNFHFLPTTVRWLWPTMVGTPLVAIWITYYRMRFSKPKPQGAAA